MRIGKLGKLPRQAIQREHTIENTTALHQCEMMNLCAPNTEKRSTAKCFLMICERAQIMLRGNVIAIIASCFSGRL